jgi:hypothetical protein
MSGQPKLDTVECPKCSALAEIYPIRNPGDPLIGFAAEYRGLCKTPPISTCPSIHAEIERKHPGHLPKDARRPPDR